MDSADKDIEETLKQIKIKGTQYSLYDHFINLYETRVEMADDCKFLDSIEDVSVKIKQNGKYYSRDTSFESTLSYLTSFSKNCAAKKTMLDTLSKTDPDTGEKTLIGPVAFVPEYHEIFRNLEWLGHSIGDKEAYILTNSLRTLCADKNIPTSNNVKFWGKIFGSKKDYYIAETLPFEDLEVKDNPDPDLEARKDGVNKTVYFVTNDLINGKWTDIGDVTPKLLSSSRKINYVFTGDLNAKIISNPFFHGTEKEFLRCQISRITHYATIIPEGIYKVNERELEKEEEKELAAMNIENLINKNKWTHFLPNILKQGRLTHWEGALANFEGDDLEKEKKKMFENDPFEPLLKPIMSETPLTSSINKVSLCPWKLQFVYDDKIYTNPDIIVKPDEEPPKNNKSNFVTVGIKSLRWPGAMTVVINGEIMYFYFGWGKKFADSGMDERFSYTDFPAICKDTEDVAMFDEPNSPPKQDIQVDPNDQNL